MKSNSKRSSFVVVLQTLLMLMPVSAFATAGDSQEIGTPTPFRTEVKSCFDVHLSPSSDRFYTLYEGTLRLYQVNPFKMLSATQGDWSAIQEKGCHALVTDDEKKLIVVDVKWIYAFDIATGRLLNKAEWGYRANDRVIINNEDLVVLETNRIGGDGVPNSRSVHNLNILDINTFKLKRKIADFGKDLHFNNGSIGPNISKVQDRIYLRTGVSLVVLNSQTYQPELSLSSIFWDSPISFASNNRNIFFTPLLSKDFQRLHVSGASELWDYLTGKHSKFEQTKTDELFVFNLKTRQSRVIELNNISQNDLDPYIFIGSPISRNKNYLLHGRGPHVAQAIVRNINSGAITNFYQYEAGDALLLEYPVWGQLAGFQLTPDARKYLMMDKEMKIPINDVTFRKYYQPEAPNK